MSSDSKEQIKDVFSSAAEQAQKQAGALGERVKEKVRDVAEQQKDAGADQIGGVAGAMGAAADELERQMPLAAEYIDDVAKQLGSVASSLRERSVDDMLGRPYCASRRSRRSWGTGPRARRLRFSNLPRRGLPA
jgi:hypothetical protein